MTGGKTFTAAVVDVGKISGGHEKVLTGSGDGVSITFIVDKVIKRTASIFAVFGAVAADGNGIKLHVGIDIVVIGEQGFIAFPRIIIAATSGKAVLHGGNINSDFHFDTSFQRSLEVVGGKRLADFFIGGEDGAVVADKIMQAGTQGTEDCVFVVMGGSFVIIALPGGKVGPNRFGFPVILEEGGNLAGIILLPGFGKTDIAIDAGGHVIGDFLLCGADGLIHATDFVVLQFHCGIPFHQRIIWVPSSRALRRVSASALRSVKFSLGRGELTA